MVNTGAGDRNSRLRDYMAGLTLMIYWAGRRG